MPSLVATVADALARSGIDVAALGLAWARVAPVVALVPAGAHPLQAAADDLVSGVALAVALGGPLLAAAVVVEVAAALVARAATPAQVHALLAPLRATALLAVMGVVLQRIAELLGRVVQTP